MATKSKPRKKITLPKLSCRFGSPMGRHSDKLTGKVWLQPMRMIDGAYDEGGAYWGADEPMYVAQDADGHLAFYRAKNRTEVKTKIMNDPMNEDISFYC